MTVIGSVRDSNIFNAQYVHVDTSYIKNWAQFYSNNFKESTYLFNVLSVQQIGWHLYQEDDFD